MSNNNGPSKVFIKVESSAEQEEHIKNSRKTLKVLQKAATDKENLAGRPKHGKGLFAKSKVVSESDLSESAKRKKFHSQITQTDESTLLVPLPRKEITAEDLTTQENPGEYYWELLAEKRRQALDETLDENLKLHERVEGLEQELNTSRQMLDEARNLVEVLTEMLNENDDNDGDNETNQGASTSKYSNCGVGGELEKIKEIGLVLENDSDDDE